MAQKKTNSKKVLILAAAILVVGVIGFLVYDEVKTNNYIKELSAALNETQQFQSGSSSGTAVSYLETENKEDAEQVVREAEFFRGDKGMTFREVTKDAKTDEMVTNVYLRPGEYYFQSAESEWKMSKVDGMDARPYTMAALSRPMSSSQCKRINKVTVDGKDAFEVSLSGQWLMNNYMAGEGKPISGTLVYILETEGDKTYVSQTNQSLQIRVTNEEGKNIIKIMDETSKFTPEVALDGSSEPKTVVENYYKDNIDGKYTEEQPQATQPAPTEETQKETEEPSSETEKESK